MNVFVLEDQLYHHNRISRILGKVQREMDLMFSSLIFFESVEALWESKILFKEFDVFVLDIDIFGEENAGLILASKIRREYKNATIIFFTAYSNFAKDAFSYRTFALDFIDKHLTDQRIVQRLISCFSFAMSYQDAANGEDLFRFSNKHTELNVVKSSILFFETLPNKHRLRLITKEETLEFTSSLNEIETTDPSFIRCHRAFVVNWMNVIQIDKSEKVLHLANNYTCPVSRTQYKRLLELI